MNDAVIDAVNDDANECTVRKRRRYSAEEKLDILKLVGESSFGVAHQRFGVSRTSVHEWRKSEAELRQQARKARRTTRVRAATAHSQFNGYDEIEVGDRSGSLLNLSSPRIDRSACMPCTTDSIRTIQLRDMADKSPRSRLERQANDATCDGQDNPSQHEDARIRGDQMHSDIVPYLNPVHPVLIGFQGERGGFTDIAARRLFRASCPIIVQRGLEYKHLGYSQTVHVLDALHKREIDYAVVASDRLFSPTFRAALDRVVLFRLNVVAEVTSAETVCICGLPGAELQRADCVMSDRQILDRFEDYVLQLECENDQIINRQVTWDSATACRIVHEEGDNSTLVLCSEEAAQANGLVVLEARLPSYTPRAKYTVLSRKDSPSLAAAVLPSGGLTNLHRLRTVLLDSSQRAPLSNIIDAFKYTGIEIEYFSIVNLGSESPRSGETCIVSYRSSDAVTEATLSAALTSMVKHVYNLGAYFTFNVCGAD